MKKIQYKKLIIIIFLLFFLAGNNYALADVFDLGNPEESARAGVNAVFSDFEVNQTELYNSIQSANVMRQKLYPPQVSLTFTPTDPADGEKVTATATSSYFMNDTKDLYFTWFLREKGCDKTDDPSAEEKDKCDLNDDGRIDVEDWKIKAMRILASSDFDWEKADYSGTGNGSYQAITGGNDQAGKPHECYVYSQNSGNVYQISCLDSEGNYEHLFPNAPHEKTGDDNWNIDEEKFWHTDPNSKDTAGTGNPDEANVTGLGENNFTWNYTSGDEVGVVVEGISINPTQSYDSSYRTMWAFPVESCDLAVSANGYPNSSTEVSDSTDESGNPVHTETTTSQSLTGQAESSVQIRTDTSTTTTTTDLNTDETTTDESSESSSGFSRLSPSDFSVQNSQLAEDGTLLSDVRVSNLNNCLYDNLLKPTEGGGASQRLQIKLTYSPQNPINDMGGIDGDLVTVNSSIANASPSDYISYTWEVYQADEPNPNSWGDPLLKSDIPGSTQTSGLGLSTFQFKMNFSNPSKYLRVKLTAAKNVSGGVAQTGNTDVIIPISSSSNKIQAFNASVDSNLNVSQTGEAICTQGTESALCPVAKGSIVGLKVDGTGFTDFMWTLNGSALNCPVCPSGGACFSGCDPSRPTNIVYFPALNDSGSNYTVNLSAINTSTGQKTNITRVFQVKDPGVQIASANESIAKSLFLGYYLDASGKQWPDQSNSNFQALAGSTAQFTTKFAGFTPDPNQYIWYVNEQPVGTSSNSSGAFVDTNGILNLPIGELGESYTISVASIYSPDSFSLQALNKYWGVSTQDFYAKPISASAGVSATYSLPGQTVSRAATNKKILASIYTALPAQLAFLFRIVLTAFVLIFFSRLILAFFPEVQRG